MQRSTLFGAGWTQRNITEVADKQKGVVLQQAAQRELHHPSFKKGPADER